MKFKVGIKSDSSASNGRSSTLSANDVDCYYFDIKVIDKVQLSLSSGEVLGIIGPNGSGKTTLIKAISGVLEPKVGMVTLNDQDVYKIKPRELAKELAVVPQSGLVQFDFTVEEIVLMGRTPYLKRLELERPEDYEVVKRAMKMANIEYLSSRPITELSGGERQRVILARALAQQPKILLLDEATSQLDISYKIEVFDLIKKLVSEGLAVIAAIHDLNLAAQYCDRLILLKEGWIFAEGSVDEVLTNQNLAEVFNVNALVKRHPITNSLFITLLPKGEHSKVQLKRIHVIPGGGEAAELLHALVGKGYTVTAGVVNILDTDYDVAEHLSVECATEAPFSPITNESHLQNLKLIESADVVILANISYGTGNIRNLEAAASAANKLVIVEENPIEDRDFTNGRATKIYHSLRGKVPMFTDLEGILAYIGLQTIGKSQK